MAKDEIVIVNGARTPMTEWVGGRAGNGKPGGALKDVSAIDLGVVAAKAALERSKVPADTIDHVILGNVLQTSSDAMDCSDKCSGSTTHHAEAQPAPHSPLVLAFDSHWTFPLNAAPGCRKQRNSSGSKRRDKSAN